MKNNKLEYAKAIYGGNEHNIHRCPICWPDVNKDSNGFITVDKEIIHAKYCPNKK